MSIGIAELCHSFWVEKNPLHHELIPPGMKVVSFLISWQPQRTRLWWLSEDNVEPYLKSHAWKWGKIQYSSFSRAVQWCIQIWSNVQKDWFMDITFYAWKAYLCRKASWSTNSSTLLRCVSKRWHLVKRFVSSNCEAKYGRCSLSRMYTTVTVTVGLLSSC